MFTSRTCLPAIALLILASTQSFSQTKEIYFNDTITRSFSLLKGSFDEDKKFVYSYGVGIGKYSQKQPLVFKIDSSGNEIWNTGQDTLFNFDGTIFNAFLEGNLIYTFGLRISNPYGFFLSIIDKQSGKVERLSNAYPVNGKGIIDVRAFGTDSIRVVYYTYTENNSPSNIPPIYYLNFHKNTGVTSTPKLYGLSNLSPLLIDQDDNAYYYTSADTLIKYNVPAASVSWKNYTLLPGSFYTTPGTNLVKEAGMVYLFGDRYGRGIDDVNGKTSWNIFLPSRTSINFYPHQIEIKDDTIYTGWIHPYSGSVTEYGHFSKVNKKTGFTYFIGTITDTGGVDYNADGSFRYPNFSVADNGEIYMMGYSVANEQVKIFKHLSSFGNLLHQIVLPPDSVPFKQYNLIGEEYNYLIKPYIFNNEPFFIYDHTIISSKATVTRSKYFRYSPDRRLTDTRAYDHNYYQYPSRTVDMQKFGNYLYVVKQQGAAAFLEKYNAGLELIWQKQLSECFVYPHAFAIDSAENICVAGETYQCEVYNSSPGDVYYPTVNYFIIIDKNGQIRKESISGWLSFSQPFDLLGANDNFYFINSSKWFTIDAVNGVSVPSNYGETNSTSGIFKGVSDNLFLSINGKDSIYVFSSRLETLGPAFYIALPKKGGSKRVETLKTWFDNGYLFNVASSKLEPNVAYICGITGNGAIPAIIKYNYVTKTTYWKFSGTTIGEAFKVVEDPAGYLYVMLRVIDSTQILKLNSIDGTVVWKYSLKETDPQASRVDLDYSSSANTVVAAGNSILNGNHVPYYIVLNAETGSLIKFKTLDAGDKEEKNYIEAVEAIPGSAIVIGGNINAGMLGGKNGFILVEGKLETPEACNIKAAFITIKDTSTPGKYNFINLSHPDTTGIIYTWKISQADSISAKNASHTFTESGIYTVSLIAKQGNLCISMADTVIEVKIEKSCQLNPTFITKQDGTNPRRIYFTNLTQNDPTTKYLWDFGDGSINDTLINPIHTYASYGDYLICLKSTLDSCINRTCLPLSVQNPSDELIAYPNPAADEITLAFNSRSASVYTVKIFTVDGVTVLRTSINASVGNNAIAISLKNLKSGLYVLELNNGDQRFSILIQKI